MKKRKKSKLLKVIATIIGILAILLLTIIIISRFTIKDDCQFQEFNTEKTINTIQKMPEKSIVVYSKTNPSIVQFYDSNMFYKLIESETEECNNPTIITVDEKGNKVKIIDDNYCSSRKKIWLPIKSFLDSNQNRMSFEDLTTKIENYQFPGEYDSENSINSLNSILIESLANGKVLIEDESKNVVNEIIYKSNGTANCYDLFGTYSYELKNGIVFEKGGMGMSSFY